jgi:hypothetical protein
MLCNYEAQMDAYQNKNCPPPPYPHSKYGIVLKLTMKIVDLVNLYCFIPLDIKLDILMDIIRPNYIKLNHSHQIWNLAKLGSGPELSPTVMVEEEKKEKRNSVS